MLTARGPSGIDATAEKERRWQDRLSGRRTGASAVEYSMLVALIASVGVIVVASSARR
jgi:hypothetical protein